MIVSEFKMYSREAKCRHICNSNFSSLWRLDYCKMMHSPKGCSGWSGILRKSFRLPLSRDMEILSYSIEAVLIMPQQIHLSPSWTCDRFIWLNLLIISHRSTVNKKLFEFEQLEKLCSELMVPHQLLVGCCLLSQWGYRSRHVRSKKKKKYR